MIGACGKDVRSHDCVGLLPAAGINILLSIMRIVKLSHFQPRLGIVSRTIATAAGDMVRVRPPSLSLP